MPCCDDFRERLRCPDLVGLTFAYDAGLRLFVVRTVDGKHCIAVFFCCFCGASLRREANES